MKLSARNSRHKFPVVEYQDDDESTESTKVTVSSKAKAHQMRRTNKERNFRRQKVYNGGRWSQKEKMNFLIGLRKYGRGKWKKVQTICNTRSNIQIKSRGQKLLQRLDAGENIFWELDRMEATEKFPQVRGGKNSTSFSSVASETDDTTSTASEVSWNEQSIAPHRESLISVEEDEVAMALMDLAAASNLRGNIAGDGASPSTTAAPFTIAF